MEYTKVLSHIDDTHGTQKYFDFCESQVSLGALGHQYLKVWALGVRASVLVSRIHDVAEYIIVYDVMFLISDVYEVLYCTRIQ